MTNEELVAFIDWEGGLESAIRHGLSEPLDDPKTKELWDAAVEKFEQYEKKHKALAGHIGY